MSLQNAQAPAHATVETYLAPAHYSLHGHVGLDRSGACLCIVHPLRHRADSQPCAQPTYVLQSDGSIRNIYDVRLRNKSGDDREFHLSLTSDEILRIELPSRDAGLSVTVPADSTITNRSM